MRLTSHYQQFAGTNEVIGFEITLCDNSNPVPTLVRLVLTRAALQMLVGRGYVKMCSPLRKRPTAGLSGRSVDAEVVRQLPSLSVPAAGRAEGKTAQVALAAGSST